MHPRPGVGSQSADSELSAACVNRELNWTQKSALRWLTLYVLGQACARARAARHIFLADSHMGSSAVLLTDCDRPYVELLVTIPGAPREDEWAGWTIEQASEQHAGHRPAMHIKRKKRVLKGPVPLGAEEPGVPHLFLLQF